MDTEEYIWYLDDANFSFLTFINGPVELNNRNNNMLKNCMYGC